MILHEAHIECNQKSPNSLFEHFFNVIELIQGFHWSKIIDINSENFIPYLFKNRIVELENTQLHSFPVLCEIGNRFCKLLFIVTLLEFLENFIGSCYNTSWHSGHSRDMYTEAVLTSSPFKLPEKDNLIVQLFY